VRACKKAEFPVCLSETLLRVFGSNGKKSLDSIVMNDTFELQEISSPKDIWRLYEKYFWNVLATFWEVMWHRLSNLKAWGA
jgi:hypothetical protein